MLTRAPPGTPQSGWVASRAHYITSIRDKRGGLKHQRDPRMVADLPRCSPNPTEVPMSQLIAMFCDIDDFCKWFEPLYMQRLLQDGQRHRVHQSQLALSEIMTIIVFFHSSHYRDFKHYYMEYVEEHLRPYFPALVSYSRFVELMPRALVPLCGYLHTR